MVASLALAMALAAARARTMARARAMGTAVTNLGRLDFPREYGSLRLDRLIMKPGGAFPLVNVNLVVGAATCAGKLSLVLEYVEDNLSIGAAEEVKDQALAFLLSS